MSALPEIILHRVIDLMREGGAANVTIRTVAARAQVSIGAVQHHFSDKDALMLAAQGRVQEEFTDTVIASSMANDSLIERALRLARAVAGLNAADLSSDDDVMVWRERAAERVSFASFAASNEAAREENTMASQDIEDVFFALVARHLEAQESQASAAFLAAYARLRAQSLLALAEGLAVTAACEAGRVTPQIAGYLLEQAVDRAFEVPA